MVNVNTYITSLWEHLWKNESWNAFYLEFSHIKNNISSKLCFCDDSMFKDQPKRDKQEIQFFSNEHINSYWFTPTLPTSTTLLKTYSLWEVLGMSLTAWSMARNPCSHSPLRTQNDKKLKCKLTISSHSKCVTPLANGKRKSRVQWSTHRRTGRKNMKGETLLYVCEWQSEPKYTYLPLKTICV